MKVRCLLIGVVVLFVVGVLTASSKDTKDAKIGYSDMVNANAGGARLGWLEWSSGIGASKDANQFGTLTFDHKPQALVPADKLASTWGDLKRVH